MWKGGFWIIDLYFKILDVLQGTYTLRILAAFVELFVDIAPYLLISIFIQVALVQFVNKKGLSLKIENKALAVFAGSIIGMLSPLPTYAAIPLGLSFMPLGVPMAGVMAFIIASPLINPSVFFLTLTQLGLDIALARVIVTFIISIAGGFIFDALLKSKISSVVTKRRTVVNRPFLYEFWRSTLFFGKYFTIALFISAVVKAIVSPQFVLEILGKHVQRSLLIAVALGVPFYSCGGAAIPFVQVLSDMGMNKGAVLAFFIAGPATKFETLYIFKTLLGWRALALYLALMFIGAYLSGLGFMLLIM